MVTDSEYLREISRPAHAYAGADAVRIRSIADRLEQLEVKATKLDVITKAAGTLYEATGVHPTFDSLNDLFTIRQTLVVENAIAAKASA